MSRGWGVVAAALGVVALVAVVAVVAATARWGRVTEGARRTLLEGARPPGGLQPVDSTTVPPVVRRYLERAIPSGASPILAATLVQEGTFQMGEGEAGWRPFTAVQDVRAYPPGFLWDATIRMAPLVPVKVRDGYSGGAGMMKGAIASLIVVVEGEPDRELAEGSLYRYLAEAPWIPTRLLPGEGLTWRGVDDSTAVATLQDGDLSVSVHFRFGGAGDVMEIEVPQRPRVLDGATRLLPWVGRFRTHQEVDGGYRIPTEGEVAWVVDGVQVPYWRGRITSVSYRR